MRWLLTIALLTATAACSQAARSEVSARVALAFAAAKRPPATMVVANEPPEYIGLERRPALPGYSAAIAAARQSGKHLVVWVGMVGLYDGVIQAPPGLAGLDDCVQCWIAPLDWAKLCPDSKVKLDGGLVIGRNQNGSFERLEPAAGPRIGLVGFATPAAYTVAAVRRVLPAPMPVQQLQLPVIRGSNC